MVGGHWVISGIYTRAPLLELSPSRKRGLYVQMTDFRASNIAKINAAGTGFDVVIVCTSTAQQCTFWQQRLTAARGGLLKAGAVVLAVHEDWEGGAGNGLGTLYAYQKAVAAAQELHGLDLNQELSSGACSAALFHTAGKGTRLAPLPGAESNNKPGVKLPANSPDGKSVSILESVIKQTGAYASSRKGRISVFWGDQVFIPQCEVEHVPANHADILYKGAPMPTAEQWSAKGLEVYGLVAVAVGGKAAQVEKVSFDTATKMLAGLGEIESVGVSLGSFSLSHVFLDALVSEFAPELAAKKGKFDTDPHFWMPLTLSAEHYGELMSGKGVDGAVSEAHHQRMAQFLERFGSGGSYPGGLGLFGAVDIGEDAYWWDYGQLRWYLQNNLIMTQGTEEAAAMRLFYDVPEASPRLSSGSELGTAEVDAHSSLSGSKIASGKVVASLLSDVTCAGSVECEGCIIVDVTAPSIKLGKGCIVYGVHSTEPIELADGEVEAGVMGQDMQQTRVHSALAIDGGKNWDTAVRGNTVSFGELHSLNREADNTTIEAARDALHRECSAQMGLRSVSSRSE